MLNLKQMAAFHLKCLLVLSQPFMFLPPTNFPQKFGQGTY